MLRNNQDDNSLKKYNEEIDQEQEGIENEGIYKENEENKSEQMENKEGSNEEQKEQLNDSSFNDEDDNENNENFHESNNINNNNNYNNNKYNKKKNYFNDKKDSKLLNKYKDTNFYSKFNMGGKMNKKPINGYGTLYNAYSTKDKTSM